MCHELRAVIRIFGALRNWINPHKRPCVPDAPRPLGSKGSEQGRCAFFRSKGSQHKKPRGSPVQGPPLGFLGTIWRFLFKKRQ